MKRKLANSALSAAVASMFLILSGCGGGDSVAPQFANPLSGAAWASCDGAGTKTTYGFAAGSSTSQTGSGTRTIATYAAADCSGTATASTPTAFTYSLGSPILDRTSAAVVPIDLTISGTTTFTIFRLIGGALGTQNLNFGSTAASTAGKDGTTAGSRHDGIDAAVTYVLQ
jgi:hypothetical protein